MTNQSDLMIYLGIYLCAEKQNVFVAMTVFVNALTYREGCTV